MSEKADAGATGWNEPRQEGKFPSEVFLRARALLATRFIQRDLGMNAAAVYWKI